MPRRELEHAIEEAMEGDDGVAPSSSLHRQPIVVSDRVVAEVLSVLAAGDPEEVARTARLSLLQRIRLVRSVRRGWAPSLGRYAGLTGRPEL